MSASCELQAVVVSADPAVLESTSMCLEQLGVRATFHALSSAIDLLAKQKVDALFVDQDLDPEFAVIKDVRSSSSSRTAVTFAIVPQAETGRGLFRGADFIIDKPVSRDHLGRALRAAYGIMLKERRRYTRYCLCCEATVQDSKSQKFPATATNISQTGIALECAAPLVAGECVRVHLRLPHSPEMCIFKGQVIWTAGNGKAGLAFTSMNTVDRERLTEWIDGEFLRQWHPLMPQLVADRFMYAAK